MLKLVVLLSGGGSNLRALLDATGEEDFPARIVAVGSDTDAAGFRHADERGTPSFIVAPSDFASRDEWGAALLEHIQEWEPDLVVCAGFMRILPPVVVDSLSPWMINTHPALLPLYPGAHAVRDALVAGATETGVTVHVIDTGVDTGPIIAQESLAVLPGESEAELHERIKTIERRLLVQTVLDIAHGTVDLEELARA
ncbi:phosphoribosylglycinamide formyltransferase [Rathayibacter tritici]|uniref:phosphoribosylglycinamide formyltransferase n=1 Tax=Rathayibacter tritici TaxID=33888 RepID=UPI000CE9103E|nr:phosphoribosylglycinamide formyltransferase [Rathayibacter tritici]PPF66573.1 phosphoribosylglycinamide formyltransferase [Rathayibacter tritici]PPG06133.1 phosphoribosylglycinamide formyltransferase [Rathayibacter tritici]